MNITASAHARFVITCAVLFFSVPGRGQVTPATGKLNIVIVEGEGAINNVKQRVNREPIVQVEDENHKPVAGAVVVFLLPDQGASGTFAGGSHTLTVTTNAQGRATTGRIQRANSGQMQIRVTASLGGETAATVITQTNVLGAGAGAAAGGLSLTAKVLIVLAVAGGAAAGTAVAVTRGGSSSSPGSPGAISISAGTPVVGAPR
jgi:hypothetical protein